ncbi:hypothetical protein [Dyella jiangningensis]|uniref:Uncharacterized protein n=1 Tax=Dyella jiangningensis TaxID=1379159 RepID=A0A328P3M1_9GAMM|nr:hypothetical protein [Dyella jiangningensis]RAO76599.1 hypothetical protein CA260_01350 [Dyella jiangningensis]
MSSLWADLLFLHGHITDLKLLRRLKERPHPDAHQAAQARPAHGKRRLRWPFRFCLGIGDGEVRTQ